MSNKFPDWKFHTFGLTVLRHSNFADKYICMYNENIGNNFLWQFNNLDFYLGQKIVEMEIE
jgi:hypothetical protein